MGLALEELLHIRVVIKSNSPIANPTHLNYASNILSKGDRMQGSRQISCMGLAQRLDKKVVARPLMRKMGRPE